VRDGSRADRHRRPQRAAVGPPRRDVNDLGDLLARFRAFGWHVGTHRRARHARARCRARCGGRRSARDHRRHGQVPRRLVPRTRRTSGRRALLPVPLRCARARPSTRPHATSCRPSRRAARRARARAAATVDLLRDAPRRGPPRSMASPKESDRSGWSMRTARAARARGVEREDLVVLDADLMVDLALAPFRDRSRSASSSAASPSRTWCRRRAASPPAACCRSCTASRRSSPHARWSRPSTSRASGARSVTSSRSPGSCPASPGHSHQGLQDIGAFTRADATVLAPSSELAVADAVRAARGCAQRRIRLCSLPTSLPFAPAGLPARGTGHTVCTSERGRHGRARLRAGPAPKRSARSRAGPRDRVRVVDVPWVNAVDRSGSQRPSRACGTSSCSTTTTCAPDSACTSQRSSRGGARREGHARRCRRRAGVRCARARCSPEQGRRVEADDDSRRLQQSCCQPPRDDSKILRKILGKSSELLSLHPDLRLDDERALRMLSRRGDERHLRRRRQPLPSWTGYRAPSVKRCPCA
jgi:hypothetical protein